MTLEWFKNPDHVVYVEKEKFVDNFAKETGIPNLRKEIDEFEERPTAEGKIVKGTRRTSLDSIDTAPRSLSFLAAPGAMLLR